MTSNEGISRNFLRSRYNGLGFDDNIAGGETAGALNVCMLAAFGNGGVVRANCVPTTGTSAPWLELQVEVVYLTSILLGIWIPLSSPTVCLHMFYALRVWDL